MPRIRENSDAALTPAEKQKRHRQKQQEETERLRGLLYRLERAVWAASDAGYPHAHYLKASSPEAILENVVNHFETVATNQGGANPK